MSMHWIPEPGLDTINHVESLSCWCMPEVKYCECGNPECGGEGLVFHAAHGIPSNVSWHSKMRSVVPLALR